MPTLPRINPTLNRMTTESPNAPQRKAGVFGEALSAMGDNAQSVGDMFKKANMVAEKTKAQNQLESSLNDIKTRAENDTDISEKRRLEYDSEINKAVGEASKNITIPEERGIFGSEAAGKTSIYKAHIGNSFMKKIVASGKADLDVYLQNKKNDFIQGKTFNEKHSAMLERDAKIKEMSDSGFLDPGEATKLRATQDEDWAKSQVLYDMENDPEMTAKLLAEDKDFKDGEKNYSHIPEEERVKLLKTAKGAIEKNKKDIQEDHLRGQIKNESDYLTQYASGKLGWMNKEDIANDVRTGKVSDNFAKALNNVIDSGGQYEPQKDENANYPEFIDTIYKANDQVELQRALTNLLEDHKNISEDKMSVLINSAMKRGQVLPLSKKNGDRKQLTPEQQAIDSGAMAVTNFGRRSGLSKNEISDMYKNYTDSLGAGKTPAEAYHEAMRTHVVSVYPPAATMDQPPNMIIDENSPIKIIFPKVKKEANPSSKGKNNAAGNSNTVPK